MGVFGQKRPTYSRQELLGARPVRNPRADLVELDNGNLEVTIPFAKPKGLTWFFRSRKELKRRFELDRIGRRVWDLCDGSHTVRQLIEALAKSETLNPREAEVSLLAYLETLGQRGIIFMATGPDDQPPETETTTS